MSQTIRRATVIGDGAMGTLCALLLTRRETPVTLWGVSREHIAALTRDRQNKRHLPGHELPDLLTPTH